MQETKDPTVAVLLKARQELGDYMTEVKVFSSGKYLKLVTQEACAQTLVVIASEKEEK